MSQQSVATITDLNAPRFPPVTQLAMGSLALVLIGGIYMVSTFASGPSYAIPTALLAGSALLWLASLLLMSRHRGFAWPVFKQVAGWALLAYVAAGNAEGVGARRAADYLCAVQQLNGDWTEEHFTGTGFPLDFMIRYHLYRISFPLLALGRLRERLTG